MLLAKNLTKSFGPNRSPDSCSEKIFNQFSLEIGKAEVVSLLGASGCGKSTLLRILAGQLMADSGIITSAACRAGYLPQDRQLLSWRSVRENVSLGMEYLGLEQREKRRRSEQLLLALGLTTAGDLLPAQISGGMKRRVALAQLLATLPDLLLLDEPLTGLDVGGRRLVSKFIKKYCLDNRASALIVTHSIEEAVLVSDRVLVMAGRPAEIIHEIRIQESSRAESFGTILSIFCQQEEQFEYRYA